MANLDPLMSSARTGHSSADHWQTPLWLFNRLNHEFNFHLDPAATDANTLCDSWYTEAENGLIQPWWGNVFLNCPYSQLRKWAAKSYSEMTKEKNVNVLVMLVAARTDTRAFWDYFRYGEVRLLPGRLKFEHPGGAKYSAPFPSAVVVFRKGLPDKEKIIYWDVREGK